MAKTYTYEDFEKALRNSGFEGQFSTADLALARRNPDAGMSLLNYKTDYRDATTDELRALANSGAEAIRKQYGEYSGGTDGSGFYLTEPSPGSFTSGTAPTFQDNYSDDLEELLLKNAEREIYSFDQSAPVYESPYGDQINGMIADLLDRPAFEYDHTTDPVYSSYAKQYTREGKRATADALGEAASATGGIPSSYAVTAATQAGDYYASQLADKIPELYEIAYNRYLQEYQMKMQDLNAVQQQEAFAYGQYQDQLGQYNTDRNFDYAKWLDEYDMEQNRIDTLRGLRNDEYNMFLGERDQFNTDRDFDYTQFLDEIDSQTMEREEEYQREQDAYNRAWDEDERTYQRGLDAYDRQVDEEKRAYDRAQDALQENRELAALAAEFGDYDALRALGIDVDEEMMAKLLEIEPEDDYADEEGISAASGTAEESVPETSSSTVHTEEEWQQSYEEAKMLLASMSANREPTEKIRSMLEQMRNTGAISGNAYRALYDQYVRGISSSTR